MRLFLSKLGIVQIPGPFFPKSSLIIWASPSKTAAICLRDRVAESTNLSRKQIAAVFDGLAQIIKDDLGKKGPGICTIPSLLKNKRIQLQAQPARNVVKAQPLKSLKEMVK